MNDTPGYVKNLKKESVVQSVINCLTDAMRNKELKPGDRIPPEPELAASMGVARSSVREAIKILSYLGVLESKRSEGTFVCSGFQESMIDPMIYGIILNQDSFDNLMELREMVETGIMRLASQKYDEEDGHALEAMLEQMKEIVHSGDNEVDRFFAVDNEFHDLADGQKSAGRQDQPRRAHADARRPLRDRQHDDHERQGRRARRRAQQAP